jgi:hypothetical protein
MDFGYNVHDCKSQIEFANFLSSIQANILDNSGLALLDFYFRLTRLFLNSAMMFLGPEKKCFGVVQLASNVQHEICLLWLQTCLLLLC